MLSPIPYLVRISIHSEPSFRSTIMCSSYERTFSGTDAPPLISHDFPLSDETTMRALLFSIFHMDTGKTHSPVDKITGLHIITPSVIRNGSSHSGSFVSGSSITSAQTPATVPSATNDHVPLVGAACAQKIHSFPSGSIHTSGSYALTGPGPSGSITRTSSHVFPLSPLVATTT